MHGRRGRGGNWQQLTAKRHQCVCCVEGKIAMATPTITVCDWGMDCSVCGGEGSRLEQLTLAK